ncbi:hypothetical protein PAEH1_01410 [Paenalcaligenes hominis]|uniref:Uncharacterized protein n=1 Tax=Paenalcaligenes hominis TaxID=643674 RepID=A0A1U9JXN8_9BURK|nr:hypothetical protein PAEH1_01410 [Paenalcaligenes hominis]
MRRTQKNVGLVRSVVEASPVPMSIQSIARAALLSEGQTRRAVKSAKNQGLLHVAAKVKAARTPPASLYSSQPVSEVRNLSVSPEAGKTSAEIITRAKELGGHFGVLVAQMEG